MKQGVVASIQVNGVQIHSIYLALTIWHEMPLLEILILSYSPTCTEVVLSWDLESLAVILFVSIPHEQ